MPFTLSHTVAVIPFTGKKFWSVTGLMAGSMVPDFEYFFRLKVYGIYGHTFAGMIWFDLPLAILLAYLFHHLIKPVFASRLPLVLRSRWLGYAGLNWHSFFIRNAPAVLLSVLVGCATHILWDSFTHNNTFMVNAWPFLRRQIDLGFQDYPMWHILQQVSSIAGLIYIFIIVYRMPADDDPGGGFKLLPWFAAGMLAIGLSIWRLGQIASEEIIKIGHVAVVGIGAAIYAMLFVSMLSLMRQKIMTS